MSESIANVAKFLRIISDPKRLEIILLLKDGEKNSAEIQEAIDKPQPTVSQHLKILRNNNLIVTEKKDRIKYYSIKDKFIFKIISSVQSYLINLNEDQIKALEKSSIMDTLGK